MGCERPGQGLLASLDEQNVRRIKVFLRGEKLSVTCVFVECGDVEHRNRGDSSSGGSSWGYESNGRTRMNTKVLLQFSSLFLLVPAHERRFCNDPINVMRIERPNVEANYKLG